MASALIHLAVAKTVERYLNIENKKDYYLGTIAPDISKQLGENKIKSHFLINTRDDMPNLEMFINKYPNFMNNSFDLGYYIHLYTDKEWFQNFLPKIINGNYIRMLDGTILQLEPEEMRKIMYQDYTNLNVKLLDEYNLDCSLFYENFFRPKTTIDEIPVDKLYELIDAMGIIIKNSTEQKAYTFDLYTVLDFIDEVSLKLINNLNKKM